MDASRFERAAAAIDAENQLDPKRVFEDGRDWPHELLYSRWLADWVGKLAPDASAELRLAARCQHIGRWRIPRESYPMDRAGYLRWREDLKRYHAKRAGEILAECGCSPEQIAKVQALNLKKNFPGDPEAQILEDALCLVFIEKQLPGMREKTDPEKLNSILAKTARKMSERARKIAFELPLADADRDLLDAALQAPPR
ncbi:MAG: DUF4202 domain-containing protein [Verrucomicrobiae bacterium]|nr:DUF4202 domain-containing protein [Verrucomicrobiae bacterium]